ncbi:FRG domain-containing protein [Candidatus Poribacteria bacterium]|nr:FRG domain-containing protein [Candidatus Poribacteria bacterium]
MSNKQLPSTTLNDYLEWVDNLGIGTFIYRGVSNEKHIKDRQIEASTCRRLKSREPYAWLSDSDKAKFLSNEEDERPKQLLKINEEMIKDARAHGHDYKEGKRLFDLDLLAELQHYGAATCLIDFSYNATVALWFACQPSSERNVDGKVVAVDIHRSHKVTDTETEKSIDCFFKQNVKDSFQLYHWQPKNQNNRIIAQRSIFIFGSFTVEAAAEYIILKEDKSRILYSLEKTLGITEESLFPDFDGFATQRSHKKEYKSVYVSGYIDHADSALKDNNFEEAIRFCNEGIKLNPDNIDLGFLLIQKAQSHNEKGDQDMAIEDCNKVIILHESNYMPFHLRLSLNLRAQIYVNRNEYHLAIQDYYKIIEVYPNDADAHYNIGRVKKHQNCDSEAKNYLEKALELAQQKDNMQVSNKEELIEKITKELCDSVLEV